MFHTTLGTCTRQGLMVVYKMYSSKRTTLYNLQSLSLRDKGSPNVKETSQANKKNQSSQHRELVNRELVKSSQSTSQVNTQYLSNQQGKLVKSTEQCINFIFTIVKKNYTSTYLSVLETFFEWHNNPQLVLVTLSELRYDSSLSTDYVHQLR